MNKTKFMHMGRMLIMMLVVLLFASCSKKDKYCSAIPKDAVALYRMDPSSFIKAHDIDTDGLIKMMGMKEDELSNIGIDFDVPMYGFVTLKGATGFVAAVKDADALTNLAKTYGALVGAKVSEKQGFHWIESNDMLIAFDDSRLLAYGGAGMNIRKDMIALLEQEEDASVMGTNLFAHISEMKQPLAFGFSAKTIMESGAAKASLNMYKEIGLKPEEMDLDFLMSLDCVKDKAIMVVDVVPNSNEAKARIEENAKMLSPIQGKYISSGYQNAFIWGAFNADASKALEYYKKNLGSVAPANVVALLEKVLGSFAGDFSFSMPEVGEKFLVQANVKNNDALCLVDSLVSISEGMVQSIPNGPNAFCLTSKNSETPVFVGVKDNTLYVANSTEAVASVNKEAETGIESFKDEICKSFFYLTVDMSKVVPLILQDKSLGTFAMMAAPRLSKLDRLNIVANSSTHIEMTLSVKDGKDFVETMFK